MPQTDRQTDKATYWCVTAFNAEIEAMENKSTWPTWVAEVHGGRELCPKTKKLHFQGMVKCKSQQRLSAFKPWLPTAHLEAARQKDALKQYALKAETAVGPKTSVKNEKPYYTTEMILRLLAISQPLLGQDDFWGRVNRILLEKPYLCGLLAKPDIYRLWKNTRETWITLMTDPETNLLMGEEAIVLQPPTGSGELISHVPVDNGSEDLQEEACSEASGPEEEECAPAHGTQAQGWTYPEKR